MQLVMLGEGEAEIIRVTVPGDPNVAQGEMVTPDELTVQGWELDGRFGMAFRARRPLRREPLSGRGEGGGVMTRLCVTVPVDLREPPWNHRYLDSDGNTCTWLHVGADGELGLYGTLDAMRQLGEAVLAAATEPDRPSTRGSRSASGDASARRAGGDPS